MTREQISRIRYRYNELPTHTENEYVKRLFRDMADMLESLTETLHDNGFVMCDIPACNCGRWHQRYGLPERFDEFRELLSDAGHPPNNSNGNLLGNALAELIAERDGLLEIVEQLAEYPTKTKLDILAERAKTVLAGNDYGE